MLTVDHLTQDQTLNLSPTESGAIVFFAELATKNTWTYQFGFQNGSKKRVSIHHPLGCKKMAPCGRCLYIVCFVFFAHVSFVVI